MPIVIKSVVSCTVGRLLRRLVYRQKPLAHRAIKSFVSCNVGRLLRLGIRTPICTSVLHPPSRLIEFLTKRFQASLGKAERHLSRFLWDWWTLFNNIAVGSHQYATYVQCRSHDWATSWLFHVRFHVFNNLFEHETVWLTPSSGHHWPFNKDT